VLLLLRDSHRSSSAVTDWCDTTTL